MATVLLSHKVNDYEAWRPYFDEDTPRRREAGFRNEKVYRKADEPNKVYIQAEMDDVMALDKFMKDPGLEAKMKEAGVVSAPEVLILTPA